jgi:peptidoglycan/xylan/chitin deacetylase (PgdA/CDA1 family)
MPADTRHPHPPVPGARWLACLGVLLWLACAAPARAESLRCPGGIAAEGDSRLSLVAKCGMPVLSDTYCAPVYVGPNYYPLPEPYASRFLPCQTIDEWLYDRGPGNLWATVRLRSGVVLSITYGHTPR